MATPDDSVARLQQFIAHLVAATGALGKSADVFKDGSGRFAERQGEIDEQAGAFNDAIDALGSALHSGLHDAEQALAELTQTARQGEGSTGSARQRLERTAADTEAETERMLAGVDDAHARLATQGIEALGHTLDQEQKELEAEALDCEQAFADLEATVGETEAQAEAAWDAAEVELDQATSDATQAGSALEAAAEQGAQGLGGGGGGGEGGGP